MAKKTIQRFLPDPNKIRHHKSLRIFGRLLHDANLWHLNRRSARGAFAVAVKLSPIPNGEVENCKAPDAEFYERSSASFSWLGLLLLPLVGLRRVFRF